MTPTRLVLTVFPSDSPPMHIVVEDEAEGLSLASRLAAAVGLDPTDLPCSLLEVPATWECDGRDGCLLAS